MGLSLREDTLLSNIAGNLVRAGQHRPMISGASAVLVNQETNLHNNLMRSQAARNNAVTSQEERGRKEQERLAPMVAAEKQQADALFQRRAAGQINTTQLLQGLARLPLTGKKTIEDWGARQKLLIAQNEEKRTAQEFRERNEPTVEKTQAIKEFEYGLDHPEFIVSQRKKLDDSQTRVANKGYKGPMDLRKEYLGQSKEYQKVRDSFTRVKGSVRNPSAAGDLSLIFNYMKMLDPGSVVRESEFATAAATGSMGERIKAQVAKIAAGERMSESMRADFISKAKVLYDGMKKQHDKRVKDYRRIAEDNGFNPGEVAMDLSIPEDKSTSTGDVIEPQPLGSITPKTIGRFQIEVE